MDDDALISRDCFRHSERTPMRRRRTIGTDTGVGTRGDVAEQESRDRPEQDRRGFSHSELGTQAALSGRIRFSVSAQSPDLRRLSS